MIDTSSKQTPSKKASNKQVKLVMQDFLVDLCESQLGLLCEHWQFDKMSPDEIQRFTDEGEKQIQRIHKLFNYA